MASINLFDQDIQWLGRELVRPECVLTTAKGDIYVSDFRGGVTVISSDGSQRFFGGSCPEVGVLKTNGFALLGDGSFLIAHLGDSQGGVFRVSRDGVKGNSQISPWLMEVDGLALPPTNFVHLDHQGRIWITVSTRTQPRADAYRSDCDDGFIVLVESDSMGNQQARLVADGLGYTNECWVNPQGTKLYANATFSRELLSWDIRPHGGLVNQTVVTKFTEGTFPDGLNADTQGNFWVTSIVSNRVIRVSPDGEQQVWLEDSDDKHLEKVEQAFSEHQMGRPHLDNNPASNLKNISSLAFTGENLNQIVLGCLLDKRIVTIQNTKITGVKPAHWWF